jgi:PAS domain S-box-containing protein
MPGLKAVNLMSANFLTADAGISPGELCAAISQKEYAAAVLTREGRAVGVIGRRELLGLKPAGSQEAGGVLTLGEPLHVREDEEIERVVQIVLEGPGAVLVRGEGGLTGVITADLLLQGLWKENARCQAYLDTLLKYASEAACVIDHRGEVQYWNPRAQSLYGIPESEIKGRDIGEFFTNLLVTQSLQDKKVFREVYHQPREGAHVLITAAPVYDRGGGAIGSISLERDIADIIYFNEELSRTTFKVSQLRNELSRLSKKDPFARIYGHSRAIRETIKVSRKYASTEATLLITGESGSGKELFAQAIHEESDRCQKPFVAVNCSAIPSALFESEIFGYEGGSFTGALKEGRRGKFEMADGGTLFLDEIGDLEPGAQVKLLRVLQEKVLYRVGGTRPVRVDVRIIAATNRDLENKVKEGTFREDLFYRLNVITLKVPPLRDRREDMPELVYLLLKELAAVHGKKISGVNPRVMLAFMDYHWPGNVRELRNVLERLVILEEEETIGEDNLPEFLTIDPRPSGSAAGGGVSLAEATGRAERKMILEALSRASGNKAEAARMLGVPRSSLYYRMKALGIVSDT